MSTNIEKSPDDCYFFFNATCTKGDACPFRHANAAYGSDVVCSFWREGKCIKGATCKYRHMEIRKSRNKVECFFETQPGGCKKPYCPYLHSSRNQSRLEHDLVTGDPADLQTSNAEQMNLTDQEIKGEIDGDIPFGSESNLKENHPKPCATPPFSPNSSTSKLLPTSPSSTAATIGSEPVSFSIDIAEESENEPEESVYQLEKKSLKLTSSNQNNEKNFGIKTLEQIRLEKVFRQNDVNKSPTETEPPSVSNKQYRVKLKRKSLAAATDNTNTTSNTPGGTTPNTVNENENKHVNPSFGIKSLDEIRRDKESHILQSSSIKSDCEREDNKPKKVIKIKRTHIEINKPSEPPSKIVKINKQPVSGVDNKSVTVKPVQQTSSSTKVQLSPHESPQKLHLRSTPTSQEAIKSKKTFKLKSTPESTTPISIAAEKSVPVKSSNVKLQLKKLTISPKSQPTIKTDVDSSSILVQSKESKLRDQRNNKLSYENVKHHQLQDDYKLIDNLDFRNPLKLDRMQVGNELDQLSTTRQMSTTGISEQDEESRPEIQQMNNEEQASCSVEDNKSSFSKNDDDFLEEDDDDLLADGESPPDDVNIEDEDDEFLKEIEHVINS